MTTSIKAAKALARHLADALKQSGQEIPHSNLLEVVAKSLGARNWHAFQATADQPAPVTAPVVVEKAEPWNRIHGFKTTDQFLADHGGSCPVCGCGNVEGASFEVDGKIASQRTSCTECDAVWYAEYALAGYTMNDNSAKFHYAQFIEAVHAWLVAGCGDEAQYELDDVIVNWFSNRQLPAMNAADDESEQERVLANAELSASDINNEGIRGQIDFLWDELRTRKALIEFLAPTMGLDVAKLKFPTQLTA